VRILAVHSSSPCLGVAISQGDEVLGERVLSPGRKHLENLAPLIGDLTGRLGIDLSELDAFGVACGPGSFSGIRVGMAVIKGLGLALGKPVAGISSLEILAWQALEKGQTGAAVVDARRDQVYTGIYKRDANGLVLIDGPMLIGKTEFLGLIRRACDRTVICGDSAVNELLESLPGPLIGKTVEHSPSACALLAWNRLSRGNKDELHTLAPLYIRRSDAEENRNRIGSTRK
jgi:tRNA threonylcarbamoyladenosine biosynthesis protein TsaB